MHSISDTWEQARQARDPRFDGRFFVGVLTTGIYCRPVCPARLPRRENVRLYPTAAAAAAAGFRPCLRCRPEASPGTPAWQGSAWTVNRALQLIDDGALDEGSVAALADRLGVTSRHLSRLFHRHLGASPHGVAQTRRLHFALRLLKQTRLPMADVCHAAGYGSVRRFNEQIRATFQRSPSELRRQAAPGPAPLEPVIALPLRYRPPLDWPGLLAFLAARRVPGVEAVGPCDYRRTVAWGGTVGMIQVAFMPDAPEAQLTVTLPTPKALLPTVTRVQRLFDLQADPQAVADVLAADSLLAPVLRACPGLRVPGCWDGLEMAVRVILGQQVSVAGATTLMARLVARLGRPVVTADPELDRVFPDADTLADANLDGLGITGTRILAIRSLARAVATGALDLAPGQDPAAFAAQITALPGIGPWTAQTIALRALNDPDACPAGDLVLQQMLAPPGQRLKEAEVLARTERWRPWRAYGVIAAWKLAQMQRSSP